MIPAPRRADLGHRDVELLLAVALERAEHLARDALGVDARENACLPAHVAEDEGDVLLLRGGAVRVRGVGRAGEHMRGEEAVARGERCRCDVGRNRDRAVGRVRPDPLGDVHLIFSVGTFAWNLGLKRRSVKPGAAPRGLS